MMALLEQYENSKPVTHVEAKDMSMNEIHLSNATLCIKFYTDLIVNRDTETDMNFHNVNSKTVPHSIRYSLSKKSIYVFGLLTLPLPTIKSQRKRYRLR